MSSDSGAYLGLGLLPHGSLATHVGVAQRVADEIPHLVMVLADQLLGIIRLATGGRGMRGLFRKERLEEAADGALSIMHPVH